VDFLIKTLIKEFYIYLDLYGLEFVLTLFKIYDSDVFYFIWIYD